MSSGTPSFIEAEMLGAIRPIPCPDTWLRARYVRQVSTLFLPGRGSPLVVAGARYYQEVLARLRENTDWLAELIPEPDNAYDPHAIKVAILGEKVGYIPRSLNQAYLAALDPHRQPEMVCSAKVLQAGGGWALTLDLLDPVSLGQELERRRSLCLWSGAGAPAIPGPATWWLPFDDDPQWPAVAEMTVHPETSRLPANGQPQVVIAGQNVVLLDLDDLAACDCTCGASPCEHLRAAALVVAGVRPL